MFLIALLPFAIWRWVSDRWHPLLAAVLALLALMVLVPVVRQAGRDWLEWRDAPSRGTCRWHRGWTAAVYGKHLLTYLRCHGWRVISADVVEPDQLRVVGVLGQQRVGLLFIRPGRTPVAADLAWLAATGNAVLVSDAAMAGMDLRRIEFHALPRLDEKFLRPAHRVG